MDFAQAVEFLVRLAAGEGLALLIVVGGGAWFLRFFSKQFWPWYTKEHRPTVTRLREAEVQSGKVMGEAVHAQALASRVLTAVVERTLNSQAVAPIVPSADHVRGSAQ